MAITIAVVALAMIVTIVAVIFPAISNWFLEQWNTERSEKVLAISNIFLALGTILLMFFAVLAYFESKDALHKDATHEYLEIWNSPYMLEQRKAIANYLIRRQEFQSDLRSMDVYRSPDPPSTLPPFCWHRNTLRAEDLDSLYYLSPKSDPSLGPDFAPKPDPGAQSNNENNLENAKEFSAFLSVRSFFEDLGAAYYSGDFNESDVFETFSLASETYWSAAISGWLRKNLPTDSSLGSEFRYFECNLEKDEQNWGSKKFNKDEILWVLKQDANLPSDPPASHPPPADPAAMFFGPRIPTQYFVTQGFGESDDGIPPEPYETFSYDRALNEAEIEDFNVVPYTSVLPLEAKGNEVLLKQVQPTFHHGAVLEVIMAKQGGVLGQMVCAGIGTEWATKPDGTEVGGYAAEYQSVYKKPEMRPVKDAIKDAREELIKSLKSEIEIRKLRKEGERKFIVECDPITKRYGMAIAVIGFSKFKFPVLTDNTLPPRH